MQALFEHLPGAFHRHDPGPVRRAQLHRPTDDGGAGAGVHRCLGQGITHLSRAVIGNVAHRVQRLAGGPGRDDDPLALQQPVLEQVGGGPGDDDGFLQAAGPDIAAGLLAAGGPDHGHAAPGQHSDICRRGRIAPHLLIHGGGQQLGSPGGQGHGGQQVIGATGGQPGEQVRRGGRDQQQVGPAGQFYVAHALLGLGVQQVGVHGVPGKGLQGERGDEFLGSPGHDDAHRRAQLLQLPHQLGGFVGGDAPADAQQYIAIE